MFFKIRPSKKRAFRVAIVFLALTLGYFSYIEMSMAGGFSSPYSGKLIDGLIDYLIKNKICDKSTCGKMIQTRTEGTKRIYINMYGQSDTILASYAVAFFIEQALNITEGRPIALRVFPKPKEEYMGLRYAFGSDDYLIKLEINK